MHIGFYNFYAVYNDNRMFRSSESAIGANLAAPSVEMAALLAARGHRVSTIDTAPLESYDAIVFLDYPTRLNRFFRAALRRRAPPLYLVLLENELIRPDNYWRRNHAAFRKVFTWHDGWVDGGRYIKIFNAVGWRQPVREDRLPRSQLCVTTAGNKFSNGREELYSARRETPLRRPLSSECLCALASLAVPTAGTMTAATAGTMPTTMTMAGSRQQRFALHQAAP